MRTVRSRQGGNWYMSSPADLTFAWCTGLDRRTDICGIYVFQVAGIPLYVGQSIDIFTRLTAHFQSFETYMSKQGSWYSARYRDKHEMDWLVKTPWGLAAVGDLVVKFRAAEREDLDSIESALILRLSPIGNVRGVKGRRRLGMNRANYREYLRELQPLIEDADGRVDDPPDVEDCQQQLELEVA